MSNVPDAPAFTLGSYPNLAPNARQERANDTDTQRVSG